MGIEQKSVEDQKARLLAEFTGEKERMQNETRQKEVDFDKKKDQLLQEKKDLAEHLGREFGEKTRMLEKRYQVQSDCDDITGNETN